MNKPIKPNITIPESFAENGIKTDFDSDLIAEGFDNLKPDVLAGDNLNKFIDDTYQGLNYGIAAADAINLIKEGETLTVIDGQLVSGATGSMPVGTIYQAIRADIPAGCLRLDGSEFTTGFDGFVTNYLATGKIISKSFAEWQTEYTMTNGNVGFFAYDEVTGKFKTPCIQAGTFLAQAVASGQFGSFLNSGLKAHNHAWSGSTGLSGGHNHSLGDTTAQDDGGAHLTSGNADSRGVLYTQYAGDHTHAVTGVNSLTGGDDTYPKHIRYPFFVVVSNVEAEPASQADWDNFVGNLDSKANKSLNNLDEQGEKHFLNKSQITNCLLEVPQRIKLELNAGVLTLKAGSVVIVPNGTGVFKEVEIAEDLSTTFDNTYQKMVFVNPTGTALNHCNTVGQTASGTSASLSWGFWYDTTNNLVKFTTDSGATWTSGFSLPICLATGDSGIVNSIGQVFNGIGFIRNTPFALPGVKVLASNGRNEDRTLKNVEFTIDKVLIDDAPDAGGRPCVIFLYPDKIESWGADLQNVMYYTNRPSVAPKEFCTAYIEDENKWIRSLDSTAWTEELICVDVANYQLTDSVITSFYPKQPFNAIDYSDKPIVSGWGMPSGKYIDLAVGVSNTTYTAPANGYFHCNMINEVANGGWAQLRNVTKNYYQSADLERLGSGFTGFLPFSKGDVCRVMYGASRVNFIKFIYAEGEV